MESTELGERADSPVRRGAVRIGAGAGVVAVGLAAVAVVVTGRVPDAADIESFLLDRGAWGPVAYMVTMAGGLAMGIPAVAWMIPAGLIWPFPAAVAMSWVAMMAASVIGFAFARWVGRDWVAARIPPRLLAVDARLGHGGVAPVIGLRLLTGGLAPADWILGLSSVRWRTFLVGTAIGIVPGIVIAVVAGGGLLGWALDQPRPVLVGLGGLALAGLVGLVLVRHRLDDVARRWRRPRRPAAAGGRVAPGRPAVAEPGSGFDQR